jgi:hypothetical protein
VPFKAELFAERAVINFYCPKSGERRKNKNNNINWEKKPAKIVRSIPFYELLMQREEKF